MPEIITGDSERVFVQWICPNDMCKAFWGEGWITLGAVLKPEDIKLKSGYRSKGKFKEGEPVRCPKCGHIYDHKDVLKTIFDSLYKQENDKKNPKSSRIIKPGQF